MQLHKQQCSLSPWMLLRNLIPIVFNLTPILSILLSFSSMIISFQFCACSSSFVHSATYSVYSSSAFILSMAALDYSCILRPAPTTAPADAVFKSSFPCSSISSCICLSTSISSGEVTLSYVYLLYLFLRLAESLLRPVLISSVSGDKWSY